jgi:catechol 2,3-dioxygenase-like lactoylglutathione lyase family enzyme
MKKKWSTEFPAVQFRAARPTHRLDKVVEFYKDGLGLKQIASFQDHDGYDGVMFGLPEADYHLEFTQHVEGSSCPAPSKDNLLVFYMPDHDKINKIVSRLEAMGYFPVSPENPYWKEKGVTIEDPDGWRIVLMNTEGL